jgi:hydrogenase maturation protease
VTVADPARAIADAVLYEGYVLWPYRRSALKNTRRWTFGGVFPAAHAERHPDDRAVLRAEVLLERAGAADVDVRVRFLQVVRRQVLVDGAPADELRRDGELHLSWDEAVERELGPGPFAVAPGTSVQDLGGGAALERTWEGLSGTVAVTAADAGAGLVRVGVEVANTTPWTGTDREDALRRTLCSTHVVLRAARGGFVSLTDPPSSARAAAAACRNEGCWPVLVGEPGSADQVLASPVILEDHPRVAPESPGDLFDGGEIDGLLVLSILALTDEEKAEMRASDPRTREILERTEALTPEQRMRLHGAVREWRP